MQTYDSRWSIVHGDKEYPKWTLPARQRGYTFEKETEAVDCLRRLLESTSMSTIDQIWGLSAVGTFRVALFESTGAGDPGKLLMQREPFRFAGSKDSGLAYMQSK